MDISNNNNNNNNNGVAWAVIASINFVPPRTSKWLIWQAGETELGMGPELVEGAEAYDTDPGDEQTEAGGA